MKTLLLALSMATTSITMAAGDYLPAVYPLQQETAGKAWLTQKDNTYTLGNDILEVAFIKENGALRFAGSEALHLMPGSELFAITIG